MHVDKSNINSENMSETNLQDIDKNIIRSLKVLAIASTNERIQASAAVITLLCTKQNNALNKNELCSDVKYGLESLIIGLSFSSETSRLGYALVLTELIRQIKVIEVEEVLDIIKKHFPSTINQENHDILLGQLFAYNALIRSRRLISDHHFNVVGISLFQLSLSMKSTLRLCYESFISLFSQMTQAIFQENLWPDLQLHFCSWGSSNADRLWLLFLCIRRFPNVVTNDFLRKKFGNGDIFHKTNLKSVQGIMQNTCAVPVVHPLCIETVLLIVDRSDFSDIWNVVVDDNLFVKEQTENISVGFEMVKMVMQNSQKKKIVKCVLSPKFCQYFAIGLLNAKHQLRPAAAKLAEFFGDYVKTSTKPKMQLQILKALLFSSSINLTQMLSNKRTLQIISHLLPETVKNFVELLKSTVLRKNLVEEQEKSVDRDRNQAITQIGALISHPATILDYDWRLDTIKFLLLHSFFKIIAPNAEIRHCEEVHEALPRSLQTTCVHNFTKAIDSLNRKVEGRTESLQRFLLCLNEIAAYVEQLIEATTSVAPLFNIEKMRESWMDMKSSLNKLIKQPQQEGETNESSAFQILFLQLGLQLLSDATNVPDMLDELKICCKKALKARNQENDNLVKDQKEPPWIAVIIDILLSLLSQPSLHMRNLANDVFPLFCPFISSEALQQILDIINPSEAIEENLLMEESDGVADDEDDVEFESGSSSEDSDDPNKAVEKVDDGGVFKRHLRDVLGPAADDGDSDSETALTDSEMFKLDPVLAEAFRKEQKTDQSIEKKTMLNFKVRCLDFITTYLRCDPPMKMVLQCIHPVLAACQYGKIGKPQLPLFLKAESTLAAIIKVKTFQHVDDVDESELETMLDSLIELCQKESNPGIFVKISSLCILIIRCFKKLKSSSSTSDNQMNGKKPIYIKKYISTLSAFFNQTTNHIIPQFFLSVMDACPEYAWHFLKPLQTYAFDSSLRIYKKTQCFGLMVAALRFSRSQTTITSEKWLKFGSKVIPLTSEILVSLITNADIKPFYITEILDFIFTCIKIVEQKTNECLIKKHPELLVCLENMTDSQLKLLGKKGNITRKKLISSLGGKTSSSCGKTKKRHRKEHKKDRSVKKRKTNENLSGSSHKKRKRHTLENGLSS